MSIRLYLIIKFMIHTVFTITIGKLKEILFDENHRSPTFYNFQCMLDTELQPVGHKIIAVSNGIYKGKKIIDLIYDKYDTNVSSKSITFADITPKVWDLNLPDETEIYLRAKGSFEFQTIKDVRTSANVALFIPV